MDRRGLGRIGVFRWRLSRRRHQLSDLHQGPVTATHTAPSTAATPCGWLPTETLETTRFVAGSMRLTVPSGASATHTDVASAVSRTGSRPTLITVAEPCSPIRTTVPSP